MSTEDRSKTLVSRIMKDIVKDIKERGEEEPMDTIKNIEELLDLAKTIIVKGANTKVTNVKKNKKRKYTRKLKPVLLDLNEKTD